MQQGLRAAMQGCILCFVSWCQHRCAHTWCSACLAWRSNERKRHMQHRRANFHFVIFKLKGPGSPCQVRAASKSGSGRRKAQPQLGLALCVVEVPPRLSAQAGSWLQVPAASGPPERERIQQHFMEIMGLGWFLSDCRGWSGPESRAAGQGGQEAVLSWQGCAQLLWGV